MRLPRKIDDRLKDAIISVSFVPMVPPATVLGYAHNLLKNSFDVVTANPFPAFSFGAGELTVDSRQVHFLSKDRRFRLDVDGQSVTFNLVDGYAGWEAYRAVIQECLTLLITSTFVRHINRVGVRYISQFNNVRIAEAISVSLAVGTVLDIPRSQLRLEFGRGQFNTILTLLDNYPTTLQAQPGPDDGFFSLIDVDILKHYPTEQTVTIDLLLTHIDEAHHEQKLLFFGLLKDNFLTTLNPEY